MSVYTENQQHYPLPLGFYEEFDEAFYEFDWISKSTARTYYKKQQELALSALSRAMDLIEMLNDYNSPAMSQGMYVDLARHCRAESARMSAEIVYLYKCAKAHFENAITARLYVANEFFGGHLDYGHKTAIQMLEAERDNVMRYLFPLECFGRWTHDMSCAKPLIARYVFADSRFVINCHTMTFPSWCITPAPIDQMSQDVVMGC